MSLKFSKSFVENTKKNHKATSKDSSLKWKKREEDKLSPEPGQKSTVLWMLLSQNGP
jgi:hypothetical protein